MSIIPSRIFIIPYRDRLKDKEIFVEKMKIVLEDSSLTQPYEIYFAHQCDNRPFNRGAMKNIGFMAMKDKYPAAYKDITFIFHDVDTYPVEKGLIDYNTTTGVVKHFYGFKFALGGMFAIKGVDFEKSNGFPNFWGWGIEDNAMNDRCISAGLIIDRSQFYDITDTRIIRTFDGFKRIISKQDSFIYTKSGCDDLNALKNIRLIVYKEYINISYFDCNMKPDEQVYESIDIRTTKKIMVPKAYNFRRNWNMLKK